MAKDPAAKLEGTGTALEDMEPRPAQPRILLIDDELEILRAFEFVLTRHGYDVDAVQDGESALNMFKELGHDVIMTDLTMPGMDGLQILRRVRDYDLDVPVVIITAAPSLETAIRALEYGALRYLLKPVRHSEILRVVQEALRLSRLARIKREAMAVAGASELQAGDQAGLEALFERALCRLFMVYQPILSWSQKRVFGYEALLRSSEPALSGPGPLFSAADRLGRVRDLSRAVRRIGPKPMSVATSGELLFLNLDMADLDDEDLYSNRTSLSLMADRAVLEITERDSLDQVRDVRAKVKNLRELGFRIAVDDLGAGYAGLTSFSVLEPEVVKLDMTLIRDVHLSATKQKLIRSMVVLCEEMGISLISEGVETTEEKDTLVSLGCDLFQGFFFARPGPPLPTVDWDGTDVT